MFRRCLSAAVALFASVAFRSPPRRYPADYAQTIAAANRKARSSSQRAGHQGSATTDRDFNALSRHQVEYSDLNSTELYNLHRRVGVGPGLGRRDVVRRWTCRSSWSTKTRR